MRRKIYKSSIFSRILFSLITVGFLIPSIWLIIYGAETYKNNYIMIIAAIVSSIYVFIILIKYFSYKVVIKDDLFEIHNFKNVLSIKYRDVIDIKQARGACYIIDRIKGDDDYYIRGTNPPARFYNKNEKVRFNINVHKLPVIQKVYISGYNSLLNDIFIRCSSVTNYLDDSSILSKSNKKYYIWPFVSSIDIANDEQLKMMDMLKMVLPYFILFITFSMGVIEYWILKKGAIPYEYSMVIKIVFPIIAFIGGCTFIIILWDYCKKFSNGYFNKSGISRRFIIGSLILNFFAFALVFIPYIYMLTIISVKNI